MSNLHPTASRRRSRRCTLCLASLVTATPFAFALQTDQALAEEGRAFPRRLPAVIPDHQPHHRVIQANIASPNVLPCAAELDPEVESWFADQEASEPMQARWLRSTTSTAASEVSRRLLGQATREFEAGAWLSAETSAWNALRWSAESVDLAARERGEEEKRTSLQTLQEARNAIREARDFSGVYGPLDGVAIQRMAISHQTDLLDDDAVTGLTATDASDRYLDQARILLAPIAKQSVEAAQSMDLLAAIALRRADAKTLPSATALSLRRAALQGQPANASLASRLGMHLADLGLFEEARWALEHSLNLQNDPETANALVQVLRRTGQDDRAAQLLAEVQHQLHGQSLLAANGPGATTTSAADGTSIRIPQITEVSPQEFAAISQPVMPFRPSTRTIRATPASAPIKPAKAPTASAEAANAAQAAEPSDNTESTSQDKPGMLRRFLGSFKRIW